jgi:2-polyprenyl-3-methyl-5-hydroxy-6-metoxy-1,4-benzoquinol methylase
MNSDKTWQHFGDLDPYYGVLTNDVFRKAALTDESKRLFFETGQTYVKFLLDALGEEFGASIRERRGVDFGCGVGRLTLPLANACRSIIGLDVSESMLAEARRNAKQTGIANVQFAVSDDGLTAVQEPLGFVHSFIVFQHIPPVRGESIVKRMIDLLEPDGIGMLHFTCTWSSKTPLVRRLLADAYMRAPALYALRTLLKGHRLREPMMQMNRYDLTRLLRILHERGCDRVHVRFTETGHLGEPFYGVILLFQKRTLTVPGG